MDRSERYLKMCEAAAPLQQLKSQIRDIIGNETYQIAQDGSQFWLPRVDTLMDLLVKDLVRKEEILIVSARFLVMSKFTDWYASKFRDFHSFDQAWLGYFMERQYGLRWNNAKERWISTEEEGW